MKSLTKYQMWWMGEMRDLDASLKYSKGHYYIEGHEGFGIINRRSVDSAIKSGWIDIHYNRAYRYPLTLAGWKVLLYGEAILQFPKETE